MQFESERELDSFFLHSILEDQVEESAVDSLTNELLILYLEEGDSEEGEKKKDGIVQNITEKIKKVLAKMAKFAKAIGEMFKSGGKKEKHMSEEDFMNAESTQAMLNEDIDAIIKSIDEEYALAKPLISQLSNLTKMDPVKVEEMADKLNATLDKSYDATKKFGKTYGKAIVKQQKINYFRSKGQKMGAKLAANSKSVQKYNEAAQANLDAYVKRNAGDPKKLAAINKGNSALSRLCTKWYRTMNRWSPFM